MHTNRLIDEKSPYLLQHAHNPVDWYPWGPAAFEKAKQDDKPIFLSVGYSTCHWCHVMERESFESEEVAAILNRYFVPVKVDREERPDVDRIYMTFVQASSGGGGWPMSVFLTPDLKPFFGGTYFPPDNRYGRPGFKYLLEQLAASWQHERLRVVESSDEVIKQLEQMTRVAPDVASIIDPHALDSGFYFFRRTYDSSQGGFGGAPKFPRPTVFIFLLRYHVYKHEEEALDMTLHTLKQMARGGMNDQLAGGFHRYSVDAGWFVPHFEKMLYDQAQLAISYLEAYQLTADKEFADVARSIFEYVLRDMRHPEGGFYSAEDADSVIDPAHPHEKGEGAFYVWTAAEIAELLGKSSAEWFNYRYGVEPGGNVSEDPHQEFTGRNILFEAHGVDETARHFGVDAAAVETAMRDAAAKLLAARAKRVRPHLDDKVLTAWNALMISAFAKGAQVLDEPGYLAAAQSAAKFILATLYRDGVLLRRFREGDAAIPGFLDDYACFTSALIDLYEADFDPAWLQEAVMFAGKMIDRFEDDEHGAMYSTAEGDASLVMRLKEDYDGAEPSGNSVAATALMRLAHITGDQRMRSSAERALRAFAPRLSQAPSAAPQMLVALLHHTVPPKQIVFAGDKQSPLIRLARARFLPFHAVLFADAGLPAVEAMQGEDGRTTAYVCENFTCQLPTSDPEKLAELLK